MSNSDLYLAPKLAFLELMGRNGDYGYFANTSSASYNHWNTDILCKNSTLWEGKAIKIYPYMYYVLEDKFLLAGLKP